MRVEFQGGAQRKGFQPIQVSDANIARMREESDRVVRIMERNAAAEKENRDRILRDMRENSDYYQTVRERNNQIDRQNIRTQQQAAEGRARAADQRYQQNIRDSEQIFGSLAKFSETAAKKVRQIGQEKFDNDYQQRLTELRLAPDPQAIADQETGAAVLGIADQKLQAGLDEAEARGADPLLVAKTRASSPGARYAEEQFRAEQLMGSMLPQAYEAALNDDTRVYTAGGDTFTGLEARGNRARTAAVLATVDREFVRDNNISSFKPEMLAKPLAQANRVRSDILARESKIETNGINQNNLQGAIAGLSVNYQANAIKVVQMGARANNGSFKIGQDILQKQIEQIDPTTGTFPISDEDWMNAIVDSSGQRYFDRFPRRRRKIIAERQRQRRAWERQQAQASEDSYKADTNRILQGLADDPSAANAREAVEFFRETYGKVPSDIEKFANSYTTEAIADEDFLELADDLGGRGMLTPEFVESARAKGYEVYSKVKKIYDGQKEVYGKEYDRAFKSLGQISKDVVGVVPGKDTTSAAALLQTQAEREFQKKFQAYLALDKSPADAANLAATEVAAEMKAGKSDANSIYFRKVTSGGAVTFPNIQKTLAPTTAAKERLKTVQDNLKTDKGRALNIPEAIITKSEGEQILADSKAGRRINIPPTARYAAARLGINPLTVINEQLEANGQGSISSPALEAAGEASPAFQELLFKTPSPMRSSRGLGSTGSWNPAVLPSQAQQYVPMIESAASANGLNPGDVAAMAEIESNWNPEAPSYNNSSFGLMQINRSAHPLFFQQNNWRDPQANLNYGAQYFAGLLKMYNGDYKAAAMAYNGGPGNYDAYVRGTLPDGPIKTEMVNHGRKYMAALYKYGGGQRALTSGQIQRPGVNARQLAYITGNIGPTSTGQHLDVKQTDRAEFAPNALDNFVEVDDPELGTVPLSKVGITGDFASHTRRGSHGIDYGTYSGTKLYVKNGAKVIGSTPSEHGDVVTIELPNGKRYTLLHGTKAN